MKKLKPILILVLTSLVFNDLFWHESSGLNIILFDLIIMAAILFIHPRDIYKRPMLYPMIGVLLTSIAILLHNSVMSFWMHTLSWFLFVGIVNQTHLKSILFFLPVSIGNHFMWYGSFSSFFTRDQNPSKYWNSIFKWTKLIVIPLFVLLLFTLIFYTANPVFQMYVDSITTKVGLLLDRIFRNISVERILFIFVGFSFSGWAIFKSNISFLDEIKTKFTDHLRRSKIKNRASILHLNKPKILALKSEYRIAYLLMISLNGLLLIVNIIDVNWIWLNFEYDGLMNLSQFVHEGTYLLIFSILISMGILFYFFRNNLNFYPKNTLIVHLATFWIIQNCVLVISVAIRNVHYITHFGLAYKRIGVFIFLIATLYGLFTLYIKINYRKTSYFVLRYNMWFTYFLLVTASLNNWDATITDHNINHGNTQNMDLSFLLSMSDKELATLFEHRELFGKNLEDNYRHTLINRIELFMQKYESRSWRSFNFAEHQSYTYLKKHYSPLRIKPGVDD